MVKVVYSVETWKLVNTNIEGGPFGSKEEAIAQYRQELNEPYSDCFKYVRLVEEQRETDEYGEVKILSSRVLREAIF